MAKRGFIHEEGASLTPAMLRLRMMLGWEGVGVFWALVEKMRGAENSECLASDITALSYELRVENEWLEGLFTVCVETGLFECTKKGFHFPKLTTEVQRYVQKCEKLRHNASKCSTIAKQKQSKSRTNAKHIPNVNVNVNGTLLEEKIKKEDPKRDPAKIEYAPGIFLLAKEYTKLLAVMTEPEITYWLNELSTAAKNQKAAFQKKYSDHYLTLLSWRRRRLEDGKTWDGGRGLYVKNQNGHGARSGGLLGDGRTTTQIYLDALAEDERNNMKKETQ